MILVVSAAAVTGSVTTSGSKSCAVSIWAADPAEIARRLGRDRSVIGREIERNRNPDGDYHARMAHARATRHAKRPKQFKLSETRLCARIEAWMDQGMEPKLIADVLARDHPDDRLLTVSHETIYQCVYVQTRGSLRADLHRCLSTKRATRKYSSMNVE